MVPEAVIDAGVVIERRRASNRWEDWLWCASAIIPPIGPPIGPNERWRVLREGENVQLFYGGRHAIALYRGDTAAYRQNLSLDRPQVYVVLRQASDAPIADALVPVHVTVAPDEAIAYGDGGDLVSALAMPPFVLTQLARFVAVHHVDQPFARRKRRGGSAGADNTLADGTSPDNAPMRVPRHGWEAP